ncbi:MAG: sulfite exporter TauE/SafE family protein, partial [Candidatus Methanomethylicia archaeon]
IHIAVATSMFTMMFTSTSSLLTHLTIGNVDLTYGVTAGFFIALGAQLGAYIAKRIKPKQLKRAFGIFLIFIGLRMVLQPIISIM